MPPRDDPRHQLLLLDIELVGRIVERKGIPDPLAVTVHDQAVGLVHALDRSRAHLRARVRLRSHAQGGFFNQPVGPIIITITIQPNTLMDMITSLVRNVVKLPCMMECLNVFLCSYMQTNDSMDAVITVGRCIISSWIVPEDLNRDEPGYVSNVSFRVAKGRTRLILRACLFIPMFTEGIVDIYADTPESDIAIVPIYTTET